MDNLKILSVHTGGLYGGGGIRFAVRSLIGFHHEQLDIYQFESLRELTAGVVKFFALTNPEFLTKLSKLDDDELMRNKLRKRRYFAESKDILYLSSPHLEKNHTQEVCGYWIATNFGRKETMALIQMACKAAEIKYGESISSIKL